MASSIFACLIIVSILTVSSKTIGYNVCLMEESYKETIELSKKWDEHVKMPALATTITFTGHLTVQDTFKMLQNWTMQVEKSGVKTQIVELPIAGKIFPFKIQVAPFGKRQIYIRDRYGQSGMKYDEVYEILEKNKHIVDQRAAASKLQLGL